MKAQIDGNKDELAERDGLRKGEGCQIKAETEATLIRMRRTQYAQTH